MKTVFNPLSGRQRGIALVITLIMLAVTLVMALAFLAISTRERGSVSTSTDAAHAREATEAALAQAEAQILVNLLANTNSYNFGLLVSTNYLNTNGFLTTSGPGTGISSTTNVDYTYADGTPLTSADMQVNVANLQYLPRPPVFVPTNGVNGGYDFRYYLDLNRNRQFDPNNGVSNWVYLSSQNIFTNTGPISEIGDPEWIGVLEHPDQPHGPQNKFIARYAFIAVPVGNTLDVNAMYNDADYLANGSSTMSPGNDAFLRNEDVGSWELNLAAFLADLNTNQWDAGNSDGIYKYQTVSGFDQNIGGAFDDALSILRYRYNYNVNNQPQVAQDYNAAQAAAIQNNGLDNYSVGPLMTNIYLPYHSDPITQPWAGSVNTNAFFSLSDFFNESIFRPAGYGIAAGTAVFPDRLMHAGTYNPIAGNSTVPTYDRYTFYHMLEELGTDSTPDYGKLNLNYVNVDASGNVVPGMETNFIRWSPLQFFQNAADRLLKAYTTNWFQQNPAGYLANYYGSPGNYSYINAVNATIVNDPSGMGLTNRPLFGMTNQIPAFGITNIPVLVNGLYVYPPSVQRLLQLAANIYDATSTNYFYPVVSSVAYPSVFRPCFTNANGNCFINRYTLVTNVGGAGAFQLALPNDITALTSNTFPAVSTGNAPALDNMNIFGIPWIIGAKKGLPSFNELYMLNNVQVTRKLQFNKPPVTTSGYTTNQMYIMGITNMVGMSFWNSYYSNYTGFGHITVHMEDLMTMVLSNRLNPSLFNSVMDFPYATNMSVWTGSGWNAGNVPLGPPLISSVNPNSFVSIVFTNVFLPTSEYVYNTGGWVPLNANPPPTWDTNNVTNPNYVFPSHMLLTTNRAQAYIIDGPDTGHQYIVDYVQFSGPSTNRNLDIELADPKYTSLSQGGLQWSTNAYGKNNTAQVPTYGEVNQIFVSRGLVTAPSGGQWSSVQVASGGNSQAEEEAFFGGFWNADGIYQYPSGSGINYSNLESTVQAPFTPTRTMYNYTLWQANDPLVHYLASDLNYSYPGKVGLQYSDLIPPVFNVSGLNLSQVGDRYQPWGVVGQMLGVAGVDTNIYNLSYKDPLVWGSDYWNFPTNLYPTVGWLGRVHRGTPWQTVYLKSPEILQAFRSVPIGTNTWQTWSGDAGTYDAPNSVPTSDRMLFDLFTAEPNENASLGELSVNQPHIAAWSALFGGMVVLTNSAGTNLTVFQPAGPNGTNYIPGDVSSYLGYIWSSIQQTRLNTNMFPKQVFGHAGDVLAAPGLSVQSPFLTGGSPNLTPPFVSEEMYEWLPQHIMSHLKVGTPRYVIYCYGQSLKPAPNGLVTSGVNALMCTNYQITSESAVRAVISVENPNSFTPHVVLKNLNPLPPDQ